MPVHLFGHPAHDDLRRLAEARGLALVEDAAHAHAASIDGRPVGTWGRAAAFSFYATKNMTTGEGGMVVLQEAAAARIARLLRNQGMERQYENEIVGFNLRMTDLAAAMGRVQLRRLGELNGRRIANAGILDGILGGPVSIPTVAEGAVHVYHQYTVRVPAEDRDRIQADLPPGVSAPRSSIRSRSTDWRLSPSPSTYLRRTGLPPRCCRSPWRPT